MLQADVIVEDRAVRGSVLRTAGLVVFRQNRLALAGLVIVIGFVLFCFLGPVFYHTNQIATNVALANQPPSSQHLLAYDNDNGKDQYHHTDRCGIADRWDRPGNLPTEGQ